MSTPLRNLYEIKNDIELFDSEFDFNQSDAMNKWNEGRKELLIELEDWYVRNS